MQLQINDDFRITTDPQNFMLQQRTIVKEGKHAGEETWKTLGYFPTLEYALEKLLDKWIKDSDMQFNSIQELIEYIKDAKDEIRFAVKKKLSSAG